MGQAKTFTPDEFDAVLDYVAARRHALRNRMLILMSFWTGMRVGEIASLSIDDVVDARGKVKAEIRLDASQTKGKHARTVFMPIKLRDELQTYIDLRNVQDRTLPLFMTAGGKPFSANVLTQHFFWLYRKAGIPKAAVDPAQLLVLRSDSCTSRCLAQHPIVFTNTQVFPPPAIDADLRLYQRHLWRLVSPGSGQALKEMFLGNKQLVINHY